MLKGFLFKDIIYMSFFSNIFGLKKKSILEFFILNKVTLPIKNLSTFSHANFNDIEMLKNTFEYLNISELPHKKYPFVFKLEHRLSNKQIEQVIIIDEEFVENEREIINIIMDLYESKAKDWSSKLENNVIKVDFKAKYKEE
jgi:hypothetical protein